MVKKKCTLLIGSPRGKKSVSYKVANYLLEKIDREAGLADIFFLKEITEQNKDYFEQLIKAIAKSEIIIFSFPLYVDSLPYIMIRAMEMIAEHYHRAPALKQRLLVIVNSGFPEPSQSITAVNNCRQFAKEIGIDWAGGIKIGGGAMLAGKSLDNKNGMIKNIVQGLDLTVEFLLDGQAIPEEVLKKFDKTPAPAWLYSLVGNIGWKIQARKHNTGKWLLTKPYKTT